jgi:hypothetical protein
MNKLKIRQQVEIDRRSIVLQKAKRSDIISGEAELSELDLNNLDSLNRTLKQMQTSLCRIDDMIILLRDY